MHSEQILLIDAYAQIYRGFFAIRYLSNSAGQPTNAVFALAKFLTRIHKEYPVEYGAFAFDIGKPAFRMEIAPDYKANRPPMPDEMKSQIPYIRKLIDAFGWPVVQHEDYEADDLVAGIAKYFEDYPVRIVSADKDIAQVINDRVQMLVPDRKGGGLSIRGPEEVVEKFGIPASEIIGYLAMIGDSSDNIPGLQGVGPKTALKLINECGSFDALMANPEQLSNEKLRAKVIDNLDLLKKNIDLVTLKTDLPEGQFQDLGEITRRQPDWKTLIEMATELELKSVLKDFEELAGDEFKPAPEPAEEPDTTMFPASTQEPEEDLFSMATSPIEEKAEEEAEPEETDENNPYTPDLFG